MTADVSGEIWDLFFRVTKRMKSRIVFDAKVGGISRGMVETNDGLELKYPAGGIEIDKSYAVSEDVVYPPDIDRFGRHFKLAVQQTLVKAVARPKHQLVWSKSHRLLIPVCCRVVYGENSHQLPDSKITLCSDFMARETQGYKTQVTNTDTLEPLDAAGNPIDAPFTVVDSSSLVGYTAGLYLQDEWRLTKSLTLNAGIRFDQYWEYISEYQFSPRVSLTWKPFESTTFHTFTPPEQVLADHRRPPPS